MKPYSDHEVPTASRTDRDGEHGGNAVLPGTRPGRTNGATEERMTLREQLLAAHNNNPIDAAASLAEMLMQGDPDDFKAGYTRANAELSALEIFPEVTGAKLWRFDTALNNLLGQT